MNRGRKQFTHRYRRSSQVPLRDGKNSSQVNWLEIESGGPVADVTYHNSLFTDPPVNRVTMASARNSVGL
jgi:hypothetical protein